MTKTKTLTPAGGLLLLAGLTACADGTPVSPPDRMPTSAAMASGASGRSEETAIVSGQLDQLNDALGQASSNLRLVKVELRVMAGSPGITSTVILANNRFRGLGIEWVEGDPRRGGRIGVTYQNASQLATRPVVVNPDGVTGHLATPAELDQQIEAATDTWRNQSCSDKPITKVAIPAGTDPDILDNLIRGQLPSANYAQTADIVQSGWHPQQFFRNIGQLLFGNPAAGDAIIGFAPFIAFEDNNGNLTDIDRNGKADMALSEVFYNARFAWDPSGRLGFVDFYSIIAHETGHALGLGHFGKIFVTGRDAADGLQLADLKFAPQSLMNAAYVGGRSEVTGTDHSSFCQIWAGR